MPTAELTQKDFASAEIARRGSCGALSGRAAASSCGLILHREQAGLPRGSFNLGLSDILQREVDSATVVWQDIR